MKKCKDPSDVDQCLRRIIRLCEVKERCINELKLRLVAREGYNENTFNNAASRAAQVGLVDDIRYAEMYIISSTNCYKGLYGVLNHLNKCKIKYTENDDLVRLIEDLSLSEFERACEFAQSSNSSSKDPFKSTMAKLIRRGYSMDIAYKATEKKYSDKKIFKQDT